MVFLKQDYTLERQIGWDALGMRGTCSAGFKLIASGVSEQILPVGYDEIHARTMMPVAHLTWSGAWTGIAAAAVDRARAFVRKATHRADGAHAAGRRASDPRQRVAADACAASSPARCSASNGGRAIRSRSNPSTFRSGMNLLKVNASELAVATVMSAMQACGLSGYRNDGEFSIGRHLRDILSSPIMISNDRILANVGMASLLSGVPASLRD